MEFVLLQKCRFTVFPAFGGKTPSSTPPLHFWIKSFPHPPSMRTRGLLEQSCKILRRQGFCLHSTRRTLYLRSDDTTNPILPALPMFCRRARMAESADCPSRMKMGPYGLPDYGFPACRQARHRNTPPLYGGFKRRELLQDRARVPSIIKGIKPASQFRDKVMAIDQVGHLIDFHSQRF